MVFFIGEHFGRRMMLIAGGAIMIIGAIILATSTTVAQLIVGRIVTGIVCDCLPDDDEKWLISPGKRDE